MMAPAGPGRAQPLELQAAPAAPVQPAARRRTNAARAEELQTFGDRLFRAGNLMRAVERFEQSAKANPTAAGPHIRLAEVALVRGRYADAAAQLREAQAADPEWLAHPPDVQSLYAEPGDFSKQIAKLEAHLQTQPDDRDGWLVLGAQWFLSGRSQKAADVFLRLTDQKADQTLEAFLDATRKSNEQ
jgi:cytochrome c-type biogenesis protein CcmH/NrfG